MHKRTAIAAMLAGPLATWALLAGVMGADQPVVWSPATMALGEEAVPVETVPDDDQTPVAVPDDATADDTEIDALPDDTDPQPEPADEADQDSDAIGLQLTAEGDGQPSEGDPTEGPDQEPGDDDPPIDEPAHPDGWSTSEDGANSYYYRNGQPYTGWVVDAHLPAHGKRRYWVADGVLATSRVITPNDGANAYWAYIGPEGYAVTGAYATTNARGARVVYLANSTGHLPTQVGWLESKAYGQGMRRYYLERDPVTKACLVRVGYSTLSYPHYSSASGYVLTGVKRVGSYLYVASSTGRLPTLRPNANGSVPRRGWLVTQGLGQGTQRYYLYRMNNGVYAAKAGYSSHGYPHYTTNKGYVVRGTLRVGKTVILADRSTGRMPSRTGWLVSDRYRQGRRRYYLEKLGNGAYAVRLGYSTKGYRHYTTGYGYVLTDSNKYLTIRNTTFIVSCRGELIKAPKIKINQSIHSSLAHGPKGRAYQRYIVLHDTEGGTSPYFVVEWWVYSGKRVGAHFVVGRDGTVVQCVPMNQIAHHAGYGDNGHNKKYGISETSRDDRGGTTYVDDWTTNYAMNGWSIGIEMVHEGNQPYLEAQLRALDGLIAHIDAYYGFDSTIIDHKAWRTGNTDTSPAFAGYLRNYQRTRTHNGSRR